MNQPAVVGLPKIHVKVESAAHARVSDHWSEDLRTVDLLALRGVKLPNKKISFTLIAVKSKFQQYVTCQEQFLSMCTESKDDDGDG